MSAFRRGMLLAGAFGVAAVAASLAWAGGPAPEALRGGGIALPAPEAPAGFGAESGVSPLVETFNASRAREDDAPSVSLFVKPKLDIPAFAAIPPGDGPAQTKAPAAGFAAAPAAATEPSASPVASENAAPPLLPETPAAPPLTPMQAALQSAAERLVAAADQPNPLGAGDWRAARAAIAFFYAGRNYEPVWVGADGLTQAGRAALAQLERASDDGLSLADVALPRAIGPGLDPDALAEAETAISSAVVIYAEQATGSRVPPARVSPLIFATPSVADPGAALAETAAASDPAPAARRFQPAAERLSRPKGRMGPAPRLDAGRIKSHRGPPGRSAPGLKPAAQRKGWRADESSAASADPGLGFAALARERAAILANMEMWRWQPRDMGERRIEVNIPDFSVKVMEGDAALHEARVIVGKPETPTPIFSNVMRYVIINPSWQVPDSIIRKEFASKLGSLSRRGYEVKTVGGRAHRASASRRGQRARPDRLHVSERSRGLPARHAGARIVRPGRARVEPRLRPRRGSHGPRCADFRSPESKWTEERIEAAIGGAERTVFLPRPLPIHIEYFTEFVDEFGGRQGRPDVYGLTRRVEDILAQASQG